MRLLSRFYALKNHINGENNMGKVKTEQIKHLAKDLIAKFPDKFNTNFDDNKLMVKELTIGATTRVRNQTAGYITRTYTLNQKGVPLQEDEIPLEEAEEA
jgi:small subunit ribosomal protein S17e